MKSFFPAVIILLVAGTISASEAACFQNVRIKVACVGNSVTSGYGLKDHAVESYPSQLENMLGEHYEVRDFGKSGATLLYKGHNPYIKSEEYQEVLEYRRDLVIIDLGLNDTDPRNWPDYDDDFIPDYQNLINSFKLVTGSSPEVLICPMTPVFPGHPSFKSGTRDWFIEIQESIKKEVHNTGARLVDLHTPLYRRPDLFTDYLHPDEKGAAIIAKTIYSAITGDYGSFWLAPVFGEHMVTLDLGDSLNVHPVRKKEMGERFALQALNKVYGEKIVPDGPLPHKIVRKSDSVVISFRSARKLKTSDGKASRELEMAGGEGIFREVQGIPEVRKVIIIQTGENVTASRYACKPFSRGNLVNQADLPASTFLIE